MGHAEATGHHGLRHPGSDLSLCRGNLLRAEPAGPASVDATSLGGRDALALTVTPPGGPVGPWLSRPRAGAS